MFCVAKKWTPIIDSDIDVSDKCCYYLKREPFNRYDKQTGEKPMIATMASDGFGRKKIYLQTGCIDFKNEKATPLGFWTEQDVLKYIKENKIDYCDAYGEIVNKGGTLRTTKAKRTGCVGCLFGIHLEKEPNRMQRLEKENRDLWDKILNKWVDGKIKRLLNMFNIKYMEG